MIKCSVHVRLHVQGFVGDATVMGMVTSDGCRQHCMSSWLSMVAPGCTHRGPWAAALCGYMVFENSWFNAWLHVRGIVVQVIVAAVGTLEEAGVTSEAAGEISEATGEAGAVWIPDAYALCSWIAWFCTSRVAAHTSQHEGRPARQGWCALQQLIPCSACAAVRSLTSRLHLTQGLSRVKGCVSISAEFCMPCSVVSQNPGTSLRLRDHLLPIGMAQLSSAGIA